MRFNGKTTRAVNCCAWAIAVLGGLLVPVTLGAPSAYAQAEIDPDHFDSPSTEPIPQPRTAERKVKVTWYERSFSVPNSAVCNGKKLAPGQYFISLRSDGAVGRATLYRKSHVIETADVVQAKALKDHDEVVVVENNKTGRMLSLVRIAGFDFVFDPKHSADPSPVGRPTRAEKLPLTRIAPNEIANQMPSHGSANPQWGRGER